MPVPGQPGNEPVELRPRPLPPNVLIQVDPELVPEVILEGLAMRLDQRREALDPPGS